MVFPGGMIIEGKKAILESMGAQPWKSFQLKEPRMLSLSEDAAVTVYKATAQREGNAPYVALISSAYTRSEGQWKLALHQQTPV